MKMEEDKKAEKKYHRLKPLKFLAVFLYYSTYKMRSQNKNKPPEFIIDWLNAWRAYRYWMDKPFLASFGKVKIRDPYSYHCKPYRNIKNVMLIVQQPENTPSNNKYTAPLKSCQNCKHERDCYDEVLFKCGDDDMKYWQLRGRNE